MCGIVGWIGNASWSSSHVTLAAMSDAVAHRGPDDEGHFIKCIGPDDTFVAFGHRRLAIIDLEHGQQPMMSQDGRYVITFNGEIYNYVELKEELRRLGIEFSNNSDTEVLLYGFAVWREDVFRKLRGMFSLAIWDSVERKLLLAIDPFGKKPLYLSELQGNLLFSSEISGITAHPQFSSSVNLSALPSYLVNRYVPAPYTFFDKIRKFPAGHYAVWAEGKLTCERYYETPFRSPCDEPVHDRQAAVETVASLLDDAVKLRMRCDAPYGAFLSGGLDSSAIVAMMNRHSSNPVRTFTISLKEEGFDESGYASMVAQHLNTEHHEYLYGPDDIVENIESLTKKRGAPISETADIPIYLLAKEAANSVKMVLSGEGSDEVFAGYPKYAFENHIRLLSFLCANPVYKKTIGRFIRGLPYKYRRISTASRALEEQDFESRMALWFGSLDFQQVQDIMISPSADLIPTLLQSPSNRQTPLKSSLYYDQVSWLPDNLLERGDRMMMAASIEGRMPFMDTQLVDFVARMPDQFLLRRGKGKFLLREAVRDRLPKEILSRKKMGFRIPVEKWFRSELTTFLFDTLANRTAKIYQFVNFEKAMDILNGHIGGQRNFEKEIWTMLSLEIFLKANQRVLRL